MTTDDLRGDVRQMASETLERECPACHAETTLRLSGQTPALAYSGAWGKYLDPQYTCEACDAVCTLLAYETPDSYDELALVESHEGNLGHPAARRLLEAKHAEWRDDHDDWSDAEDDT